MSFHLLLATRRGLWRCPLDTGEAPRAADFHRDAPESEIAALAAARVATLPVPDSVAESSGGSAGHELGVDAGTVEGGGSVAVAALATEGRLLLWDAPARAFREGASLPLGEEVEWEVLAATGDGGLLAGACPAGIATYDATGDVWTEMAVSIAAEVRAGWQGLETPYEPRITALLSRGTGAFASVSVGGLLQKTKDRWEAAEISGLPRDLRGLAWAFGRLWLASGRGLFSWTPPPRVPELSDDAGAGARSTPAEQLSSPGAGARSMPAEQLSSPGAGARSTPAEQLSSPGAGSAAPSLRKSLLPADASFVAALAVGRKGLVAAAAPGPPATWRGPDGARMSLWLVEAPESAPRRLAGPFHGSIPALFVHGEHVLAGTSDGELWRIPLSGEEVDGPWLEDLPPVNDLMVIDLKPG